MRKTHFITLEEPIVAHEVVRQLEFREPKWPDIIELGDPYTWLPFGDMSRRVDDVAVIGKYAERLIVKGDRNGDPLMLAQMGIIDTKKVRDLIVGFFLAAFEVKTVDAASKTSGESSSSTSDGAPQTSPA